MTEEIFEMAAQYRSLLKDMRFFIGNCECRCVMTEEYEKYESELLERFPDSFERMAHQIMNPVSFENYGIAEECQRCSLLEQYVAIVGFDADNLERQEVLENSQFDEKTVELIKMVIDKIQERYENGEL